MIKKYELEIDENLIAMAAFTKIVKKYYQGKGVKRDPKALKKIKIALVNPQKLCKLDISPDKVYKKYEKLGMFKDVTEFNISSDIDVQQLEDDILNVVNEFIDFPEDFGNIPFINAGKWLNMVDDRTYGYYKIGDFAPGRDDDYFFGVLNEKMKYYKPHCDDVTA